MMVGCSYILCTNKHVHTHTDAHTHTHAHTHTDTHTHTHAHAHIFTPFRFPMHSYAFRILQDIFAVMCTCSSGQNKASNPAPSTGLLGCCCHISSLQMVSVHVGVVRELKC